MRDRDSVRALAVLAGLLGLYFALTFGFLTLFFGDWGTWAHEVDRFVAGDRPYADFVLPYPPVALWTYAVPATLFGPGVKVLLGTSALITVAIFVSYWQWIRGCLDPALATPVLIASALLAIAYSSIESETLAAGMFTPAMPIGGLLLIGALSVCCDLSQAVTGRGALIVGALLGLLVLTKQDFWMPAATVLGWSAWFAWNSERRTSALLWLGAGLVAIIVPSLTVVLVRSGAANLVAGVSGLNRIAIMAGRGFPSWERIVLHLILLSGAATGFAACLGWFDDTHRGKIRAIVAAGALATAALCALYITAAAWHGTHATVVIPALLDRSAQQFVNVPHTMSALALRGGTILLSRLRVQGWSIFLAPLALGWLIARWRSFEDMELRRLVLMLLTVAIAARVRRLFEHVDWYHLLLEIPALLLWLKLVLPTRPATTLRASRAFVCLLAVAGAVSFADWTLGPVIGVQLIDRLSWGHVERVETAHGVIRMPEQDARAYREIAALVNTIDPSGTVPVFATRSQGAWAYFLGRRNPTMLIDGFTLSGQDPERVLADLQSVRPAPIVIDIDSMHRRHAGWPDARLHPVSWELSYPETFETRIDSQYYNRLLANYEAVGHSRGRIESWTVYRALRARKSSTDSRELR